MWLETDHSGGAGEQRIEDVLSRLLVITAWYPSDEDPHEGTFVRDHVDAWRQEIPRATGRPCSIGVLKLAYSLDLPNYIMGQGSLRRHEQVRDGVPTVYEQALRVTNRICFGEARAEGKRIEKGYRTLSALLGAEPDLIVAQTISAAMCAVELRKKLKSQWPIVLVEHSVPLDMHLRSRCRRTRGHKAVRDVDEVIVVGDRQVDDLAKLGRREDVTRIWNPVHEEFLTAPGAQALEVSKLRLVTISRLSEQKGLDRLLKAFALLSPAWVESLDIIGGGPLLASLKSLAEQLGIADRVRFQGARQRSEIIARLSLGGVFLLTSRWDNCPVSLLEAQSMGLPCVVVANGASENVLLEGNGICVSADEPDLPIQIASAVRSLVESCNSYRSEQIRERARNAFSSEIFTARCLRVFRRACERRAVKDLE